MSEDVALDVIGNDELDCPEFHEKAGVNFLNLRGDQHQGASLPRKVLRILSYYAKLIRYAAKARPRIFHILWNNKFELFDRTLLMLYYRLLGKKVVFTAHNVNARTRDGNDTGLNRLTLRIQYRLSDHIFVHTERMKTELMEAFGVSGNRITVIPFGINNAVPNTRLTRAEARERLGIREGDKAILFFGNITPYKGLEYLVTAFEKILSTRPDCRLIIAGKPGGDEKYWSAVRESARRGGESGKIILKAEFIPDEETQVYFKAADVLALPYRHIYQSGVLFLGYSFGLPALVADVGCLKDDVIVGKTGFIFKPEDPEDLTKALEAYFASDLFADLEHRREEIIAFVRQRHSWQVVSAMTMGVYAGILGAHSSGELETV